MFTDHCSIKKIKLRKIKNYKENKSTIRMSSYDSEININTIKKYFPYSDKKINYNRVQKMESFSREIYPNINIQKKLII